MYHYHISINSRYQYYSLCLIVLILGANFSWVKQWRGSPEFWSLHPKVGKRKFIRTFCVIFGVNFQIFVSKKILRGALKPSTPATLRYVQFYS